jgi:hypothetical protein
VKALLEGSGINGTIIFKWVKKEMVYEDVE